MNSLLGFVKDWNFLVPAVLWGWRELARWALVYRRRSLLWGFRRGRSVVLLREQPSQDQGYLFGEVGALAVARAGQRVADELRKAGLDVIEAAAQDFDPNSAANIAIVSLLEDEVSAAGVMAQQLGVRLSVEGNTIRVGNQIIQPRLRLADGMLRTDNDYGILIRGKNPNDDRRGVTIIATLTAQAMELTVKAISSNAKIGALLGSRRPAVHLFILDMRSGIVRTRDII